MSPVTETPSRKAIAEEALPQGAGAGPRPAGGGTAALLVAAGILLSRLLGLVRQRVFAHYLGNSVAAAAFMAALRIPNFLQNLFGEGVLSASFIPVYAALVGKKDQEEADRVAGAVFGLLCLVTGLLVAGGMLATPLFIDLIAPGFEGGARELTIRLVRILFPGIGLLVLSAWCLGILNSHRKFFLSYAAPVLWNCAIIASLLAFGGRSGEDQLAVYVAWGAVVGGALQFGVQLPSVLGLLGRFRPSLLVSGAPVRQVLRSFGPVVTGRGVVQVSAYVDTAWASLVSERALSALSYAQTLYLLPVSLFGMAISAAELPAMSQATGSAEEIAAKLRGRIAQGLERIAFFVVPSAAAFGLLGDVVGGALLQTGRFSAADTRYVWYLLMGSAVGLLAVTMARLYASAFYALQDTRTPLYIAVVRVVLGAGLAFYCVRYLPGQLGVPGEMGAVGITASSGLAGWLEYQLLRRSLARRIGDAGLAWSMLAKLWGSALLAAGLALAIKWGLGHFVGVDPRAASQWGATFLLPPKLHPVLTALLVLGPYGIAYFAISYLLRVPQSATVLRRLLRRQEKPSSRPT